MDLFITPPDASDDAQDDGKFGLNKIGNNGVLVKGHTWYGMVAHIVRHHSETNKPILVRCTIKEFILFDNLNFIGLNLDFVENQKSKSTNMCPVTLWTLNYMWLRREIMSDSEQGNLTLPCVRELPALRIFNTEKQKLSKNQINGLGWILKQVEIVRLATEIDLSRAEDEEVVENTQNNGTNK